MSRTYTLTDPTRTTITFAADGQLLSLACDGSAWNFVAPCHGWSLRQRWTDDGPGNLWPAGGVCEQAGPHALTVRVSQLVGEDGGAFEVDVELRWELVKGRLQGRILKADLPAGLTPAALAFPEVRLPYGEDPAWVVPNDIGGLIRRPCAGGVLGRQRPHMQFTAWLVDDAGLYLDTRDGAGWTRSLLLNVESDVARLSFEHLLPQPESGPQAWPEYPVSLQPFVGGWYQAARLYRPWALQQVWARRGPDERRGTYLAEVAGWLWNRGRIDNVCPATKEVQRRLGLPLALDWYWWHKHPYDTGYPDYFPPREGAERFKAAVADLQAHDVAVQVYTNGMSWDQDEAEYQENGRQCILVHANGELWGHVYNTWMGRKLMHTCGAAGAWHQRAMRTADGAAALGLDGLYMDQIGIIGGLTPCFSTTHGHVPGGGNYGVQGYRELFTQIRQRHPDLRLSSESVSEVYQDLLEANITLQTSHELPPREVIPLFQAVYHGHSVVFGLYTHIDGITPWDDLWPADQRPDPSTEKDWRKLCPDQFCLALARTVAYGCQPLACNLTMEHLEDPRLASDVEFFLDCCRFYHAHREWLLWGELLSPETLETAQVEVSCLHRCIFTKPETIEPFAVTRPAVFHSAWRAPDGTAGLVLVNYTRDEQTARVERPDGLVPAGGPELTLPARSLRFLPLA